MVVKYKNTEEDLLEVAKILVKLREKTKYWEEHYGAMARGAKKYYERKADEWILQNVKHIEED